MWGSDAGGTEERESSHDDVPVLPWQPSTPQRLPAKEGKRTPHDDDKAPVSLCVGLVAGHMLASEGGSCCCIRGKDKRIEQSRLAQIFAPPKKDIFSTQNGKFWSLSPFFLSFGSVLLSLLDYVEEEKVKEQVWKQWKCRVR